MKKIATLMMSFLLLAGSASMLTSCSKEEDEELIDENQIAKFTQDIVGKWQLDGTNEFWRFDAKGSGSVAYGENWDEGEDVHEGEGNDFRWEIDKNGLMVIYKNNGDYNTPEPEAPYSIKSITSEKMIWVTSTNHQQTLKRIK